MEIRLLGPVQAWADGARIDLGPRKQRLLLAVLSLEINRFVTVDRLVDLTWPAGPPRTARKAIQVSVSRLRAAFVASGGGGLVELATERCGYVLRADPGLVDAHRFRSLVTQARVADREVDRLDRLEAALLLWQGPPLVDVADAEVAGSLTRGLVESWLVATEELCESRLRLGHHDAVVGDLVDLVERYPDRQRLVGALMVAHYRSGRAVDALAAYRRLRVHLAEALGLDPEPRLKALESAILRGAPGL